VNKKIIFMLASFWIITGARMVHAEKVVVVLSRSLLPYEQAWRGFEQTAAMEFTKLNMHGNVETGRSIMQSIAPGTKAVVVIGSEATMMAKKYITAFPVVYTMVLEDAHFTIPISGGLLMQVKLEDQLGNISRLFPGTEKIGVIYNMHYSHEVINQARQIVKQLGLHLVPIAVGGQNDILMALEKITRDKVDVLWSVVDPTVAKPEAMQMLIKHTLKEKIPFVALSRYHVKAGALAAVSVDYHDMGAQTAALTKRILATGTSQPVQYPRKFILFINSKTQQRLGINRLPDLPGVHIINE
jgi:putative ABC transport system substrate-binding protein